MCREYTFYPAPTQKKCHPQVDTACLYSLMADEQENQIKQISKKKIKKN